MLKSKIINSLTTSVVCWYPLQTVLTQIRLKKSSGLIWSKLFDTDGISERILWKKLILKKIQQMTEKHEKLPSRLNIDVFVTFIFWLSVFQMDNEFCFTLYDLWCWEQAHKLPV